MEDRLVPRSRSDLGRAERGWTRKVVPIAEPVRAGHEETGDRGTAGVAVAAQVDRVGALGPDIEPLPQIEVVAGRAERLAGEGGSRAGALSKRRPRTRVHVLLLGYEAADLRPGGQAPALEVVAEDDDFGRRRRRRWARSGLVAVGVHRPHEVGVRAARRDRRVLEGRERTDGGDRRSVAEYLVPGDGEVIRSWSSVQVDLGRGRGGGRQGAGRDRRNRVLDE